MTEQKDVIQGRVKWFNSKYGYGFVKDLDSDNDYFAHQSQLQTNVNCYKTLYQGEYIECNIKNYTK